MEIANELVSLRRRAPSAVVLLFVMGVGLVTISLLGSAEPIDWYKVAYDFGLGALIATGLATVVSILVSRLEAREAAYTDERREQEAARLDAQRELADRTRREFQARLTTIDETLNQFGQDMRQSALEWKMEDESRKTQYLIVDTIEPVLTQLYELRTNVDPKFEHPNEPFVTAIMKGLRELVELERWVLRGRKHSGRPPPPRSCGIEGCGGVGGPRGDQQCSDSDGGGSSRASLWARDARPTGCATGGGVQHLPEWVGRTSSWSHLSAGVSVASDRVVYGSR